MSRDLRKPTRPLAGHPTHIRYLGTGQREVLALHCSLAHGGAWAAMAEALGKDATLIAPDLPSHGYSAPVPRPEDLHDLSTAMAKALADEIGGGRPIDVIGHSFGASVALRLALEAPELVASLSLFEPVLFAAARPQMGPGVRRWHERQTEVDTLVHAGDLSAAARSFHADWGHGTDFDTLPARQRDTIQSRLHLITASNAVLWDDAPGIFDAGRLEGLHIPVLLAEGAESPPVIAEVNATLAARLPNARRLRLAGAAHMLPLTHAPALAPEVATQFRARVPSSAG